MNIGELGGRGGGGPKLRNLEQTYILNAPKDIWMYFSFIYTSDLI